MLGMHYIRANYPWKRIMLTLISFIQAKETREGNETELFKCTESLQSSLREMLLIFQQSFVPRGIERKKSER